MTPGARIQAAGELLEILWQGRQPPGVLITEYFRKRRYAGSSDRRAIQEHLFAVLRHRARLDWWIERTRLGLETGVRTRLLAHLALVERMRPGAISNLFSGARHCPHALSNMELELAASLYGRPLNHADMPVSTAYEFPAWMTDTLSALWGDRLGEEAAALNQTAPVDLRVNMLKSNRGDAKRALADVFIETEETVFSPLGLRVNGHPRLRGTKAFKLGLVEIQDEGSQLIALLVGAQPGMNVVDFCAGAGGKTLALAATMGRDGKLAGRLTACDISKTRLDRLRPRLRRAGAYAVKCRVITAKDDNWVAEQTGRFDRVLVDVPCTGTGTWRRDPNAKWRITGTNLDDLIVQQRRILKDAAGMVRTSGRLIYATCSLLQEENERQMSWFIENHPDFQPLDINQAWSESIGGTSPAGGSNLRLSPAMTATDGFFCAILVKTP